MPTNGSDAPGSQPDGDEGLAHVDQDHAEREAPALGAQRVGATGIAAALLADVDAAQAAHHEAAEDRAEQIGEQGLDAEFQQFRSPPERGGF